MIEQQNYWEIFKSSGKIDDYLKYKEVNSGAFTNDIGLSNTGNDVL